MSKEFIICCDTIIDTNEAFFIENDIKPIEHGLVIDGKENFDGFCKNLTERQIYDMLRSGKEISTVQGNIEQMYNHFETAAESGKDALYICFSSALSGTYNTACMVANDVMEKFPERKILVVDTKSAAAGQGILVRKSLEMKQNGSSMEEIVTFVTKERDNIHHFGFIDNLEHLKRGGRISKTTAFVGGIVGIKPILKVTEDGYLVPFTKARGLNNAFKIVVDKINETYVDGETVYISHCDNLENAEQLRDIIIEKTKVSKIEIYYLGNTIGCHLGPDSVAVFYKGTKRF